MIAVSVFNPIDFCRILILLELEVSAMMGYAGAVFKVSLALILVYYFHLPYCIYG